MSAHDEQVGGTHYTTMGNYQPLDVVRTWYGNQAVVHSLTVKCLKYLGRWQNKNGPVDLQKLRHCVDLLIEEAETMERHKEKCDPSVHRGLHGSAL